MVNVIRWDPFSGIQMWNERLNRLIGRETSARSGRDEALAPAAWVPPVDIVEGKEKITLKAELPGFKESDVAITVEDSVLTMKGERRLEKESDGENYHRIERTYGSFSRSFTLPASIDQTRINALFADGILSVEMAKREETQPKQIKITAGGSDRGKDVDVQAAR